MESDSIKGDHAFHISMSVRDNLWKGFSLKDRFDKRDSMRIIAYSGEVNKLIHSNTRAAFFKYSNDLDESIALGKVLIEDNPLISRVDSLEFLFSLYIICKAKINKGDYSGAEELFKKGLNNFSQFQFPKPIKLSLLNSLLISLLYQTKFSDAYPYLGRLDSLKIDEFPSLYATFLVNKAHYSFYNDQDFKKATQYVELAEDQISHIPNPDSETLAKIYSWLGFLWNSQRNYSKARGYFYKSIELFHNLNVPGNSAKISNSEHNIGVSLEFQRDYSEALKVVKKSIHTLNKERSDFNSLIAQRYLSLGRIYAKYGYQDSSIFYLNQIIPFYQSISKSHHNLGFCYEYLGDNYAKIDSFSRAKWLYDKAINLNDTNFGFESLISGLTYYKKAKLDRSIYSFSSAYDYSSVFIKRIKAKGRTTDLSSVEIAEGLLLHADILYQLSLQKPSDSLKIESLHYYEEAFDVMDQIKLEISSEREKLYISEMRTDAFEQALRVARDLYETQYDKAYLERAWALSERSRASVLRETLMASSGDIGGPWTSQDSILLVWEEQKNQFSEQLKTEEDKQDQNLRLIKDLKDSILQYNLHIDGLKASLRQQFPQYHQLKYQMDPVPLETVKASLDPEALFLEYFSGDSSIHVFAIHQGNSLWMELPAHGLKEKVQSFLLNISNEQKAQNARDPVVKAELIHNANEIYHRLLYPVLDSLKITPSQAATAIPLTLVADAYLGQLPFEVLLTDKVNISQPYNTWPYLLKAFRIHYAYSASLMHEGISSAQLAPNNVGSFAPAYHGEELSRGMDGASGSGSRGLSKNPTIPSSLRPLPNNEEEANFIKRLLGGDAFIHDQASEARFRAKVDQYRILHLAMHGFAHMDDPAYSALIFTPDSLQLSQDSMAARLDNILYAYEIYNLPLAAELVVLSACETGVGKYQYGEGIMSLARAFTYAGCPSVVMSLWQADDGVTRSLMEQFYTHLKAGSTKDEAIRLAKLDHLNTSSLAHPYYWSTFVQIGDPTPMKFSEKGKVWRWVTLCVLLIIAISFWGYRRYSVRRKMR